MLFLYTFSNIYRLVVQFDSVPRQRLNCKGFYPIIKNVISKFGAAFLISGFCKIFLQNPLIHEEVFV
ncbi:hypothetical protein C1I60_01800 [Paenibacillus terrae]|uniref:Uncharacterized protein n=1 Tax=Paenibacillus terrae TaxID=159743 RepID=A0A4U2Q827_9BACL|nr:hypothetical protein C1I60_01800 [Paenibacillus terrae]